MANSDAAQIRFHVCEYCAKTFKQTCDLKRHVRTTHTEEKPFVCDICQKAFKRLDYVKRHKHDVHSGLRPFACDVCNRTFAQRSNLKQHELRHTKEGPFKCNTCKKRFTKAIHLKLHKMKANHWDEDEVSVRNEDLQLQNPVQHNDNSLDCEKGAASYNPETAEASTSLSTRRESAQQPDPLETAEASISLSTTLVSTQHRAPLETAAKAAHLKEHKLIANHGEKPVKSIISQTSFKLREDFQPQNPVRHDDNSRYCESGAASYIPETAEASTSFSTTGESPQHPTPLETTAEASTSFSATREPAQQPDPLETAEASISFSTTEESEQLVPLDLSMKQNRGISTCKRKK